MANCNSHSDDELNQLMMEYYSHIGDESAHNTEGEPQSDEICDVSQSAGRLNEADSSREDYYQIRGTTDQQLISSFLHMDDDLQRGFVSGKLYSDDEVNRFLKPYGTNFRQEEDSYSAIMKQWNDEREAQEMAKNELSATAQEINDERKVVGLYNNVPGDFAETLIFYDPFTFNFIVDEYMETILSNIDNRSVDEWLGILKRFNEYHKDDSLIPRSHRNFLKRLEDGPFDYMTPSDWELLVKVEAFMYYEWSVYPDVRAITVPVNEENDEDYETFRVYVIGISWSIAGSILNTMLQPRFPKTSFNTSPCQMLIAVTGHLWAFLPRTSIPFVRGTKLIINNGRKWSFREQMLATILMRASMGSPEAQNIIIILSNRYFMGNPEATNFGLILLLILSTEFMGFAVAGLQRAFFVYPSKMVYFDTLYVNSLSRALVIREPRERVNGWILKRWEFFALFSIIWFGWYWVTYLAFTALSDFDWLTWLSPENVNLNAIAGTSCGLGIVPISTFNPAIMQFTAIYTPWNALWQYTAGTLVITIAAIIIWYTNTANTGYLPINLAVDYDNTGNFYNMPRVLNNDYTLNQKAYESYSSVYYTATTLIAKGITFMYYPAQLVSCVLNYWRDFVDSLKAFKFVFCCKEKTNVLDGFEDRFSRTARGHSDAPEWWFLIILFSCLGIAIAIVEHWNIFKTPVYSIILSYGIGLTFMYPLESLRARTTYTFDIKPLLTLINGMIFKANPIGFMTSTLYGAAFTSEDDGYIGNLKTGHYAGIAPRSLFRCQAISLLISCIVQAGLVQWQASGKFEAEFCNPDTKSTNYTCQIARNRLKLASFDTAISSKRIFHDYPYLKWTFLIGALYPLPLWITRKLLACIKSRPLFSKIIESDFLVILDEMVWLNSGLVWIPLNNWQFVGNNFLVGILWHKWIRPTYPQWFGKYTYLFYSALMVSFSFGMLFQNLAYNKLNFQDLSWWGNNVNSNTLDGKYSAARLQIPKRGYFGPDKPIR